MVTKKINKTLKSRKRNIKRTLTSRKKSLINKKKTLLRRNKVLKGGEGKPGGDGTHAKTRPAASLYVSKSSKPGPPLPAKRVAPPITRFSSIDPQTRVLVYTHGMQPVNVGVKLPNDSPINFTPTQYAPARQVNDQENYMLLG